MQKLFEGQLRKMQFNNVGTETHVKPEYFLGQGNQAVRLNPMIGKKLAIRFTGKITCIACGRETRKSYGQGYCYPCFISVPQTEECVLRPELCRAHEGIARDMEFAEKNCLVDQIVYLALSGGLKVGVTRHHQVPTRWVDQGANWAMKLAIASNRYSAGLIEVALKKIFADKTNWRKMLTGNDNAQPLAAEKERAISYLKQQGLDFAPADSTEYSIEFPVQEFPAKVISKSLDKEPDVTGLLKGIKGQYLILDKGNVINLRKHSGYNVIIEVE